MLLKLRLVLMMYLQFFIWGAWYATGGNYMKSHNMGDMVYLAYMVSPIGSIVSPFFLGMIADRYFAAQKVMGVLHILSGIFVICAPWLGTTQPAVFLLFLLFHMLCYMPTVSLAAATSFHVLSDGEKEYPIIRLFGTIGWISAGFIVSYWLKGDVTALPMYVAGIGGILMGLYSFTLPNVPPRGAGKKITIRDIIGWDALRQLSSRPFIIFIIGLLLISIPFASYFAYVPIFLRTANIADPAFKMTFGQMSEVLFLLLMPWLFRKWGIKWVMVMGLVAWSVRYGLFALGAPDAVLWMLVVGILLHGACYDFVYVASQVYIDQKATPEIRAQAQGFFVLVSYGVGQGLGTLTAGWIFNKTVSTENSTLLEWQHFWEVPLIFSVIVTLLFLAGFSEKDPKPVGAGN
jgi:nucleoside transporter